MYLGSIIHTKYLELSIITIVYWFKVEDDNDYLKKLTQHNIDLTRTVFQEVFHKVETREYMFGKGRTNMGLSRDL